MAEYFICHSITGMFWNLISLQEEPAEQVECHINEQKPEEMHRAYDKSTSILQSRYVNGNPKKLTKRGACCYQLLNYFQLVITYYVYVYIFGQSKQINVVVWFIDKTVLYEKARDSGQKANCNRVLHAIQGNFYMPVHYPLVCGSVPSHSTCNGTACT